MIQRIFIGLAVVLFLGIGVAAVVKKNAVRVSNPLSIVAKAEVPPPIAKKEAAPLSLEKKGEEPKNNGQKADRIRKFFSRGIDKFPIVETVTYTSRVSWLKGRPAWIADYASHYQTSRHFIARGLNGKADYLTQVISPGDKFNVYRTDKNFEFYLLVDLKGCTMDFYYLDHDTNERVFIKSYAIGVGRLDPLSPSGSLTPVGKFTLGPKVGIYKPGIEHYFQNQKTEMIEVFGTRWMPFDQEIENCSDSAKGYGIHGVPCSFDKEKDLLIEAENGVNSYNSDGCIRLHKDDVEELFSIVITKRTIVEIVKSKEGALLPMAKESNE